MWIQEFQKHVESNFNEKWLSIIAHCGDNWYFLNSIDGLKNWVNTMMVYLYLIPSFIKKLPLSKQHDSSNVCSTFVPDSQDIEFIIQNLLFKLILNDYSFQYQEVFGFKVFNFYKHNNTDNSSTQLLTIKGLLSNSSEGKNYYSLKKEGIIGELRENELFKENIDLSNHLIGDELFTLLVSLKKEINSESLMKQKKDKLLNLIESYFKRLSAENLFSINFLRFILNNDKGDGKYIIETQLLIIGPLLKKLNLKECEQEDSQDSSVFVKRAFQFSQLFTQTESSSDWSREPFDSPLKQKLRDILDILVNYDKLGRNDMDDRKKNTMSERTNKH